jgi:hypothetical protein
MPAVEANASTVDLPPNSGKGTKIAILGGGIAGMVTAQVRAKKIQKKQKQMHGPRVTALR